MTETFEFTGASEDFVVPADVCEVTIEAFGAQGGPGNAGEEPGLGGSATASIAVTPGETLVVTVGGQGAPGQPEETVEAASDADVEGASPEGGGGLGGAGGFNGGGDGGGNAENEDGGGGGGGASDVRQGGDGLEHRVVVGGG
ncbi:MAG TPA: glycine-rich protein, partial [Acidimicrobiales bacterium]|nr:glycine-rich protein [Acidimicrobiales bacterium]